MSSPSGRPAAAVVTVPQSRIVNTAYDQDMPRAQALILAANQQRVLSTQAEVRVL
jgi:hypothetical protein